MTGLEIIAGLDAADELGDAAIEIIFGNVPAAGCLILRRSWRPHKIRTSCRVALRLEFC